MSKLLNSVVVDARPTTDQSRTSTDRQRFVRRARSQVKEAVKKAISSGDIKSLEKGNIRVPVKGMNEPTFENDTETGRSERVYTGNKEYIPGDTIDRPTGGSGSGNKASDSGEGEDDFAFVLTPEEFYDVLFEDLQLPDLMKKQMAQITQVRRKRAGYVTSGNPAQLDVKQTYKYAFARHKALGRPSLEDVQELEDIIESASCEYAVRNAKEHLEVVKKKQEGIPFFDNIDLRYRNYPPKPEPITKACMVCIMDTSGSMDEHRKDLAKRFFLLLYVWLSKQYDGKVDIVFVRHTTTATECDEQTFFYSHESGGTVVSPALTLTEEILRTRYPTSEWNNYICQASDGDNWHHDNELVMKIVPGLLELVQYFAYVQVYDNTSGDGLWSAYEMLAAEHDKLNKVLVTKQEDIWPVFQELWSKESA